VYPMLFPFVRDRRLYQCERTFWALPGAAGADGRFPPALPAMPAIHIHDVTIPICTYTKAAKVKRAATRGKPIKSAPKKSRKVVSSDSDEKDGNSSPDDEEMPASQISESGEQVPDCLGLQTRRCCRGHLCYAGGDL